jgi:hypothetical protein
VSQYQILESVILPLSAIRISLQGRDTPEAKAVLTLCTVVQSLADEHEMSAHKAAVSFEATRTRPRRWYNRIFEG